ncbi:MAG: hypothetical protein DRJ47_06560 [Thermoprotei archaeon]|nr:MAG: hypothetical protein DRJ47_06560 [Thermoprotei archaeon]
MKDKGNLEIFEEKSCNRGSSFVVENYFSYFWFLSLDFSRSIAIMLIKTTGREAKDGEKGVEKKENRGVQATTVSQTHEQN